MMRESGVSPGGAWLPRRLSEGLGAWRSWYGEGAAERSDAAMRTPSPPQHRSVSPPSRQGVENCSFLSGSEADSSFACGSMMSSVRDAACYTVTHPTLAHTRRLRPRYDRCTDSLFLSPFLPNALALPPLGHASAQSMQSCMSDVDAARLAKAEARSRAREAEKARIANENRENEKRKAAVGACAVVKLSGEVEAQRAVRAAERSADKEAKVRFAKRRRCPLKCCSRTQRI